MKFLLFLQLGIILPRFTIALRAKTRAVRCYLRYFCRGYVLISFYSPQMVATVNTTKYTIENDLTKKGKKEKNKNKEEEEETTGQLVKL